MTDAHLPIEDSINDRSLRKLIRAITLSDGNFSLILARCNYGSLRDRVVQQVKCDCPVEIRELYLLPQTRTLYTTIQQELAEAQPSALMIFGLESISMIDQVLTSANQVREEFRKHFSFPIVLWVNDEVFKKLVKLAPDLKSWAATSINFEVPSQELVRAVTETANATIMSILEAGSGRFFINIPAKLKGFSAILELEFALQDLNTYSQENTYQLHANLEFLLGLVADSKSDKVKAKFFYENSIVSWKKHLEFYECFSEDYLHYACSLFHLGVWWRQYATQNRSEYYSSCDKAKDYYQSCLEVFEKINRPDLSARFINALGEVLVRVGKWEDLERVARNAVYLHEMYSEPVRRAFGYALFTELKLQELNWKGAKKYAELALHYNNSKSISEFDSEWNRQHYRSFYLLLLARSQKGIGKIVEATINLEFAKASSKPQSDPLLYIEILKSLYTYYFHQSQYLKAFGIKQEQKLIEQQFGLRAFIGAGRLQERRQVNNPGLAPTDQHTTVAQEIAASGRIETVNYLVKKISRSDCKLIIIHGQSGVGKSSTLQAGLIPILRQHTFEAREVLPVLIQTYTDWENNLGSRIASELKSVTRFPLSNTADNASEILEHLSNNISRNLLTILIFDQFEEFFFTYRDRKKRDLFYTFLSQCLNTSFVKVIFCLREDCLHYMLEFNRSYSFDILNKNILDKEIIYHIGNLSQDDTRAVIQSITQQSQLHLEIELINELVRDLTEDNGEIRPIELQIVGAQLQTENITTLAQYVERGPKRKLVENFLEEVIKDCGVENESIARHVLLLLTDENYTRPLRTKTELEAGINSKENFKKVDLILEIFVKSGLVFILPEVTTELYQLVHDYLVIFIRKGEGSKLTTRLKESEESRRLSEAQLVSVNKRKFQLKISVLLVTIIAVVIGVLALWAVNQRRRAESSELRSLIVSSENSSSSNQEFDALFTSLKAANLLNKGISVDNNSRQEVLASLQKSIYRVKESNRLEGHNDWINDLNFSPDGKKIVSVSSDETIKFWELNGKISHNLSKNTKGHTKRVNRIIFSHDKRTVATASNDNTIKVWSMNGDLVHTLVGHENWVGDIDFSPDDKTIVSVSSDGTIRYWRSDSGVLQRTVKWAKPDWLKFVKFSPDGKLVVAGGNDGRIKICSLNSPMIESSEGHGNSITGLSFSADGKVIASASSDQTIKLWTLDGELIKTLEGHRSQVNRIEFSPDPNSRLLVSSSQDGTVKLWSQDGKLRKTMSEHAGAVNDVKFSPDGNSIAAASDDKTIKFWNLDGVLLKTLEGHTDGVSLLRFSPDGRTLASAGSDKTIRLWNLSLRQDVHFLPKLNGPISKITFSPNGDIAVLVVEDPKVWFYDAKGNWLNTLSKHYDAVLNVEFKSDGNDIATASADGYFRILDRSGKKPDLSWLGTEKTFGSYTTSGLYVDRIDSSLFLTVTGVDVDSPADKSGIKTGDHILEIDGESTIGKSRQEAYRLLDSKPGRTVNLLLEQQGNNIKLSIDQQQVQWHSSVTAIAFNPRNNNIAGGGEDGFITIWDNIGTLRKRLNGNGTVNSLSFSPNGKMLASASTDETVTLWDTSYQSLNDFGKMKWQARHAKSVSVVKFSFDGQTVFSGSEDRTIKIWDLDGKERMSLPKPGTQGGHDGRVNSISSSLDGQIVVSGSEDKTVKLWNAKNGNLLTTFYGHNSPVVAVRLESDARTVTSISSDGAMIHWNPSELELYALLKRGCSSLQDYLSNNQKVKDADRKLCDDIPIQR